MSIPCVAQVRVFAPRSRNKELPTVASSWSLPAWILPLESASSPPPGVSEDDDPAIILHSRIASPLGIEDGDDVLFELVVCGERFKREVTVSSEIHAPVIIFNALSTEIATRAGVSSKTRKGITTTTTTLTLQQSKREIELLGQDLWCNEDTVGTRQLAGTGILHFNGASRNNKSAGFGFSISTAAFDSTGQDSATPITIGPDLVNGYCYCGSSGTANEMEFSGLLEGLEWAILFDFETLYIRGDSENMIQQVCGVVEVKQEQLVEYFYNTKIQALLDKASDKGTEIIIEDVAKESNVIANVLANLAIDLKENATACNWDNINKQCRRSAK